MLYLIYLSVEEGGRHPLDSLIGVDLKDGEVSVLLSCVSYPSTAHWLFQNHCTLWKTVTRLSDYPPHTHTQGHRANNGAKIQVQVCYFKIPHSFSHIIQSPQQLVELLFKG